MIFRRLQDAHVRVVLGWLPIAALAACVLAACEDSSNSSSTSSARATGQPQEQAQPKAPADRTENLNKRCEQLSQACGQQDKHKEQIGKECKEAAKQQVDSGCADQAVAAYDCYEKAFCIKGERIWALDDFRVLTERHSKCVEERKAIHKCAPGSDKK